MQSNNNNDSIVAITSLIVPIGNNLTNPSTQTKIPHAE